MFKLTDYLLLIILAANINIFGYANRIGINNIIVVFCLIHCIDYVLSAICR